MPRVAKPDLRTSSPAKTSIYWYDPNSTTHDFGKLLAGTDVNRSHIFRIANTSDKVVRVLGVANRKPCCGEVNPVPATVLNPGGSIEVTVDLHIGLGVGQVDHFAELEVEGADPVLIRTSATAYARLTITDIGDAVGPVEPGQSRRVEFLVRSFGLAGEPPIPLDDRAIRCGLPTEWVGPSSSRSQTDEGIIEVDRTLAVRLPAASEPGRRSERLDVLNKSGAVVGGRFIAWEITPALIASPSGLVFAATDRSREGLKIVVRSHDGRAFRIESATTKVDGLVVSVDAESRPMHKLEAVIKGRAESRSRTGEIVIRTDHLGQPLLKIAVYVPGQTTGETSGQSQGETR